MLSNIPVLRGFSLGRNTQTANTAIISVVEPYPGPVGDPPFNYQTVGQSAGVALTLKKPNWYNPSFGVTHVTDISMLCGSTAHQFYLLRPLNYTSLSAAVAKNATVFNITGDPGIYSTGYNYPTPGGAAPTLAADNAIAASDYVVYQLDDGSWQSDIVSSVATLAITMTTGTPNRAGCTIAAGKPLFWYGIQSDVDPVTGQPHPGFDTIASTRNIWQSATGLGLVSARHPGDPLLFLDANATAADFLNVLAGFYAGV